MNPPLLVEIGTEELPPKSLWPLAAALADGVAKGLAAAGIAAGPARALASPRRLTVMVEDVASTAADQPFERLGPAVRAAFDADGEPTPAATGFAKSLGVAVAALQRQDTDKGERLAYAGTQAGARLAQALQGIMEAALKALPIAKRMRWGEGEAAFVRPVHWLVALHGDALLPLTLFACEAGRVTYGHRFHHPQAIALTGAADYETALAERGRVLVDFAARRARIQSQVAAAATALGGEARMADALLDEVTALVEWPVTLVGSFEARFLELPEEVLVATLEGHQRWFPVAGADGRLMARFVAVANIDSSDPDAVVAGNERVVRPRLADALFFWETDRKRGLAAYAEGLERVSFQRGLGSLADKTQRVGKLGEALATALEVPAAPVARAAALAKADLLCEMVGEFPELQGTMGGYYARDAGEDPVVAAAIAQHYAPRAAGAAVAASPAGQVLALADRLDTLAGAFALGKRPSGEKDPFGLRRAALAVLRTAIEARLALDLPDAIARAVDLQPAACARETVAADLLAFHAERLRAYYQERGVTPGVFESVAALGLARPLDFERRVVAVQGFMAEDAAAALCSAHKRIRNILKAGGNGRAVAPALLREPAELALGEVLLGLEDDMASRAQAGDYGGALARLATLQAPVDRFFDEVLVMADDPEIRANRLALLGALDALCRQVADISRLDA